MEVHKAAEVLVEAGNMVAQVGTNLQVPHKVFHPRNLANMQGDGDLLFSDSLIFTISLLAIFVIVKYHIQSTGIHSILYRHYK
jgi:hypothetical protein